MTFAEPEEVELESAFVVGVSSTIGIDTWVRGDGEDHYVLTGGGDDEGPLADLEGGMMVPAEPGEELASSGEEQDG